ncbi:MAG: RidA family protein, partial [Porticoccaceae bacterium]|nr:RidA family protein [Porticoccaceae bacterium]
MITTVKTDLYASPSPLEWATVGNGILFTAQIPINADGNVVEGGIEAQTRQTMDNLKHTLEKAGAGLDRLTQ